MKKTTFFTMATLITFALLSSCNSAEKPEVKEESATPIFDISTARNEIDSVNRNFMEFVAKHDSAGIASLYATDAKVMFDGGPAVAGRQNIQSTFAGLLKSGVTKVDLRTKDLFGSGDMLAEEGEVTIYVKDQVVGEEKYLVLWKKEDGKWRLFRDIMNSNLPAKGK